MSIDAMKQALAAIEAMLESINSPSLRQIPFDKNVQAMVALRAAIEQAQEPVAWVYPEGLEALKIGRPWTAYGSSGEGRIPLYLNNDAVARRVEPRSGESGAGFESLPASPKWKGLTEAEKVNVAIECGCADVAWMAFADAIEAKLKAKNS